MHFPVRNRLAGLPLFNRSWATVLVALNGEVGAAAAGGRLRVPPIAGTACRRLGGNALVSAGLLIFSTRVSLLRHSGRVEELLDALRHAATLVSLQVIQLVCCRLGCV